MGKSKVAAGSVAVPKRNKASLGTHIMAHRWLYIMLIPGLLYYIIFHYVPMFGIIIASVSYTHLDVYKRQGLRYILEKAGQNGWNWNIRPMPGFGMNFCRPCIRCGSV